MRLALAIEPTTRQRVRFDELKHGDVFMVTEEDTYGIERAAVLYRHRDMVFNLLPNGQSGYGFDPDWIFYRISCTLVEDV